MRSIDVPGVGPIQFPDSMSDDQIIQAIERDILPGASGRTQAAPAQGLTPATQQAPAPQRGFFGNIASTAGDVAASAVTGAGGAVSGLGGVGGILGLGYDNPLSRAGRSITEFGQGLMSPELTEKREALSRAIQEAESQGLVGEARAAFSAIAENPSLLAFMTVEQILPFVLSAGVGRGASAVGQIAARRAAAGSGEAAEQAIIQAGQRAGQVGTVGTAAGLQGGSVAEQTYQDVMGLPAETIQRSPNYQELLRTMSPDDARAAIADRAAREAGLLAGGISVGAMSLMPSAERAMFSRGVSQSAMRRALGVGTGEAVSEAIEEGGGQFAQNLAVQRQADEERALGRGVGGAAATGAVLGGVMGAGVGALQRPPEPPSTEPGAGNLSPDLRAAIDDYVANREPETPDLIDSVRLVTENLPVTAEQFLGATERDQEILLSRARREAEGRAVDDVIFAQAGPRADAFRFEEGRDQPMDDGRTQAEFLRERTEDMVREARQSPPSTATEDALREARRTQFAPPGTQAEQIVRAAQEIRAERKPPAPFFPLVENFIEGHVRTYGDEQPISVSALQQYVRERTGRTLSLGQARGILDTYYNASSERSIPSGQGWVLQRDTVNQTETEGEPSGVDGERMPSRVAFGAGAQTQNVYRAVAAKGARTDETGFPVTPSRPTPPIPADESGFARPQRAAGGQGQQASSRQAPEASARQLGAEQAATQVEAEPTPADARLSRRVEAQNKINALYLDKLKGMGAQGRLIRNGLVDALKNRSLSAEQVYGAFTAADVLAPLMPAGANHRIEFTKEILPNKQLAEAISRSGGNPAAALQGLRTRPSDAGLEGIITLSLAPDMMPYLRETAAHEAFHVLQDYYGKYDPQFKKLMDQSFRDGMMISDVDPTIRRKLEQARYPGSSKSYFQVLTETLPNAIPSVREAQAYAFGSLLDASRRGVPMTGLKPAFARFVNFIKNFFSKLGSKLRGDGFQTAEEVLGRAGSEARTRFDQSATPTAADGTATVDASARSAPPFIRSARQLLDDAKATSSWRDWYERHERQIEELFGSDAPLFRQILSATSQAASVASNVSLALKAYEQLLSNKPFTGYLPAVIKNLDRIKADEALQGQKIAQYGKANEVAAEAAGGVAVDRHIAQLMFGTDRPTKQMVQKATKAIQSISRLLGWQPREVQAALWAFNQIRGGVDPANVKSYDFYLSRKQEDIKALRSSITRGEGGGIPAGEAASIRTGEANARARKESAVGRTEASARTVGPAGDLGGLGSRVRNATPSDIASKQFEIQYTQTADMITRGLQGLPIVGKRVKDTAGEDLIILMQDRMLPLGRMVDVVRESGGTVVDASDVRMAEELYSGRTGAGLDDRKKRLIKPLLDEMRRLSVSVKDIDAYLYARHAPEVNAFTRSINEDPSKGSGMTDQEAAEIMKQLAPQKANLDRVAKLVDAIIEDTNKTRSETGLTPDYSKLNSKTKYKHYVPLRGFADADIFEDKGVESLRAGSGQGFKIRGKEDRSRMGRTSQAADILANVILQNQETVIRSEKNRVGQSLLKLIQDNPEQAKGFARILEKAPVEPRIVNGKVKLVSSGLYKNRDDVMVVKEGGNEVAIEIYDERLAKALTGATGLGAENSSMVLRALAGVNRWLAMVNTTLNPEFIITNFTSDLQTANINIKQFDAKGLGRKIVSDIPSALAGARAAIRGGDTSGKWSQAYEDFRRAGGTVEFLGLRDVDSKVKQINEEVMSSDGSPVKRPFKTMLKIIEDYNTVADNAIRLSTFQTLRDLGVSDAKAAQVAKNLTTNFNKAGQNRVLMNSLYLFYNASIQGTMAMANAIVRSKRVRKYVGGIIVAGFMQDVINSMMSDMDEDERKVYDKIPDHVLARNYVLMDPFGLTDRGYYTLPMPYGFNAFFNMGRNLARVSRGEGDPMKTAGSIVMGFVDAFNPIGGTQSFLNFAAPTILDPLVDLRSNLDFANRPIVPEERGFGPATPESQRFWSNTFPPYVTVAQWLNQITGGTSVIPGQVDISPNTIKYLMNYATGAAGAFAERVVKFGFSTVPDMLAGDLEEVEVRDIPLLRKLYGNVTSRNDLQDFMENTNRISQIQREFREAERFGESERIERALRDYPNELAIAPTIEGLVRARRRITREMNEIRRDPSLDEDSRKELLRLLREEADLYVGQVNLIYNQSVDRRR